MRLDIGLEFSSVPPNCESDRLSVSVVKSQRQAWPAMKRRSIESDDLVARLQSRYAGWKSSLDRFDNAGDHGMEARVSQVVRSLGFQLYAEVEVLPVALDIDRNGVADRDEHLITQLAPLRILDPVKTYNQVSRLDPCLRSRRISVDIA